MMRVRLKLLPVLIMLLAGAATSIITFVLHYDSKKATWILLGVLILFYILGIVLQKVIHRFETQIAEEEARLAEEEGKIVEKDSVASSGEESEGSEQSDDLGEELAEEAQE